MLPSNKKVISKICALQMLTKEYISYAESSKVQEIEIDKINYEGWAEWRLKRLEDAYKNKNIKEFDPVKCVEFRVNGQSFYALIDGNHRCCHKFKMINKCFNIKIDDYTDEDANRDVERMILHNRKQAYFYQKKSLWLSFGTIAEQELRYYSDYNEKLRKKECKRK